MRLFVLAVSSVLILSALAACTTQQATDDADDDPVAVDTTPTPVDEPDPTPTPEEEPDPTPTATPEAEATPAETPEPEPTPTEEPAHEPTEHVIEIVNPHDYDPEEIRIVVGDTVTWINNSDMPHTATGDPEMARDEASVSLPEGAEPWDSGMLQPGEEFSHTFDVAGEYVYFCIPHEVLGQIGTIIVVDDPADLDADDDDSQDHGDDEDEEDDDEY